MHCAPMAPQVSVLTRKEQSVLNRCSHRERCVEFPGKNIAICAARELVLRPVVKLPLRKLEFKPRRVTFEDASQFLDRVSAQDIHAVRCLQALTHSLGFPATAPTGQHRARVRMRCPPHLKRTTTTLIYKK